jgi:hypothetical protein
MQSATPATDTIAGLTAAYPGWHVWRGRDGNGASKGWYATRLRRHLAAGAPHGLAETLGADDPASLRALLAQQRAIEDGR